MHLSVISDGDDENDLMSMVGPHSLVNQQQQQQQQLHSATITTAQVEAAISSSTTAGVSRHAIALLGSLIHFQPLSLRLLVSVDLFFLYCQ